MTSITPNQNKRNDEQLVMLLDEMQRKEELSVKAMEKKLTMWEAIERAILGKSPRALFLSALIVSASLTVASCGTVYHAWKDGLIR